jgi:hypothetical protein
MELITEKMHKEDEREAKEAALLELEELKKECTFYQEFFENITWLVRVISPLVKFNSLKVSPCTHAPIRQRSKADRILPRCHQ